MPSDDEQTTAGAERIVLGTAMLRDDGSAVPGLAAIVGDDSAFSDPRHQTIWQAITAARDAGEPTGLVAIAHRLLAAGELQRIGGAPYLHDMVSVVPTAANGTYYACLVAEAARRRRAGAAAIRIGQAAANPSTDLAAAIDAAQADLTDTDPQAWPDPIPLTADYDLPRFPVEVLPDWLADMVTATATATQTPMDLAGSTALSVLSAAMAGRVLVEPRPGWIEQTNLFVCTALGPGNRKSAVFDALAKPLRAAEAELVDQCSAAVIEARTEKAIAMRAAEAAVAAAGKSGGDPEAKAAALSAAAEAEELVVPSEPQITADDITPEATKTLLAQHGGRLSIMSAEGGIFATIAGRYSGVPDLDVYLKGHAGDELRVTRKSAAPEFVERPVLTIGLAVQPSVLRDAAAMPGFEDRGLLARFLFTMPVSTVGWRDPAPAPIPVGVIDGYHRRVRDLTINQWHVTEPVTLNLTTEARQRIEELEKSREPRLRPDGEWHPILSWANKWVGTVARIAALLHIAEHLGDGWRGVPIDADTIDAAALIGHYYACHALAVWNYMGASNNTSTAETVLDWLTKHRRPEWTKRDLWRSVHRRVRSPTELDTALALLEQHGHIRIHRPPGRGRGRRPAPRIQVHPNVTGGTQ